MAHELRTKCSVIKKFQTFTLVILLLQAMEAFLDHLINCTHSTLRQCTDFVNMEEALLRNKAKKLKAAKICEAIRTKRGLNFWKRLLETCGKQWIISNSKHYTRINATNKNQNQTKAEANQPQSEDDKTPVIHEPILDDHCNDLDVGIKARLSKPHLRGQRGRHKQVRRRVWVPKLKQRRKPRAKRSKWKQRKPRAMRLKWKEKGMANVNEKKEIEHIVEEEKDENKQEIDDMKRMYDRYLETKQYHRYMEFSELYVEHVVIHMEDFVAENEENVEETTLRRHFNQTKINQCIANGKNQFVFIEFDMRSMRSTFVFAVHGFNMLNVRRQVEIIENWFSPWQQHTSSNNNKIYYFNRYTKQSLFRSEYIGLLLKRKTSII
eukprot:831043_1